NRQAFELRNWIDTREIAPGDRQTCFRSILGLQSEDIVVLYSGSMSVKQGLEYVLAAARQLSHLRSRIVFVLCGAGPMRAQLATKSAELCNVRLLDIQPASKLSELLATADIHVIPQRVEAADLVLPSKLAGILASGRPVIAMTGAETQL